MLPPRILLKASAAQPPSHRTVVMADYSDGSSRDVTRLAIFLSNNEASATISRDGVLTATNSGGAWVFGRFDNFTAGSEIIVLPESDDFTWPEAVTPVNFIDEAVFARLRQFQIPPSLPADDATFLRRLRLDLTGLPPSPVLPCSAIHFSAASMSGAAAISCASLFEQTAILSIDSSVPIHQSSGFIAFGSGLAIHGPGVCVVTVQAFRVVVAATNWPRRVTVARS
jgi:hypothetical protein